MTGSRELGIRAFLAKFRRPPPGSHLLAQTGTGSDPDLFARIPFELHILILAQLEPRDVVRAIFSGSRTLRLVWLSDEVWPALADRWYPGLSRLVRLTAANEPARADLFLRSLKRITRRNDGKFISAMYYGICLISDHFFQLSQSVPVGQGGVHSYSCLEDLELDDTRRFSRFMMYNNGRLAWWPEAYSMPYLAVVDDLRSRVRRTYLFPNHGDDKRGYRTAMGDKLFVMGQSTTLHVWHLELDRLESFKVPEIFKRCITEGETVLVVSQSSDVFLWRFGQTLQRLDMRKLSCYPRESVVIGGPPILTPKIWLASQSGLYLRHSQILIDFIINPIDSNVFFVVVLALENGKLTVYEVIHGEITGIFIMEDRIYASSRTSERGLLKWTKLDSYGGYCLVQIIQEPATTDACPCGRSSRQLVSLCFNIHTGTFSTLRHHLGELSPLISHIWNDRLLIMDDNIHSRPQISSTQKRPVMSLAPCSELDALGEETSQKWVYTSKIGGAPLNHHRYCTYFETDDSHKELAIELGLDVLQDFAPQPQAWREPFVPVQPETVPGRLVGDDNFLVFVMTPIYTVLNFENHFRGKIPMVRANRSWWRKQRAKESPR
ncbi:hypothetical protein GGR57DRAFT_409607 [Xylariaceae sp. FL1272]|nr:hypothetical protein GGR57DRAFT_409607 [Xylariaceae sp. FL1272]